MMNNRRKFLLTFGMIFPVTAASLHACFIMAGQSSRPPQIPGPKTRDEDAIPAKPSTKGILDDNEKEIKKKIERLFELATDLKEQVEKTDSSKVLSLVLVKKAEEIEKLARDIKSRAKG
jgi:hypothetical protein